MSVLPELVGLPPAEAERVRADAQRHVMRQPPMLAGLIACLLVPGLLWYYLSPIGGIMGFVIMGALIGGAAAVFVKLVATPKIRDHLRAQGYPRRSH